MAKLVDPKNPQHKYEPPICRFVSMIPLEADAIRKRGLPILPPYKLHSEPIYSCPRPSRKSGIVLFSVEVYDYEGLDAHGEKCPRKGLILNSGKRANLSIEHTEFAVRVMWADETGVAELLPGRDILVQVSREEAARILRRGLADGSSVYIVGESPEVQKIRPANLKDTEDNAQPDSAMFMLGPVGVYPKARITRVTIDGQELEYYCKGGPSI
jgi:hypothetical protein